jgi:cyanophycinase
VGAHAQGTTVAIGGALQESNAAVWQRLVQLVQRPEDAKAGAGRDCYSVITLASGEPQEAAERVLRLLARHGSRGVALKHSDDWASLLPRCRGVYMTGGAQARLLEGITGGSLAAMRAVWAEGGVIAGSSAGAAVLSHIVFRDAPDILATMQGRLREGQEWARGFGFTPADVIVDQHAVRRGRMGRLLPLMALTSTPLGVAVEEDTAALFSGGSVEALGAKGLLIADLSRASGVVAAPLRLQGATLHWLESGDRFNLATRQVMPAAHKAAGTLLQPLSPTHRGYLRGNRFYADLLGEGMLVAALMRLVDGDQRELFGLSATLRSNDNADPADPKLGFEWRLWLDEATRGWLVTHPEGYTISGARLDIVPVQVRQPPYQAIEGRRP